MSHNYCKNLKKNIATNYKYQIQEPLHIHR